MAWQLDIHTIDVGQGESSLLVAYDVVGGNAQQPRTMLIDGGEGKYAERVHDYIVGLGITQLDSILVSHYDSDHAGGIASLLIADNAYRIADLIAQAAHAEASVRTVRNLRIAYGASAAMAVILGAYALPGADHSDRVYSAAAALALASVPTGDAGAAAVGYKSASEVLSYRTDLNPSLRFSTTRRNQLAKAAAIAAADALEHGQTVAATRSAVFNTLRTALAQGSRFETGGLYANTRIIDIGDTGAQLAGYELSVNGAAKLVSGDPVLAPGIARIRVRQPALGSEVLWGGAPIPNNAPTAHVVACQKMVWMAPPDSLPISGGLDNNGDSIGLIIRFNNFTFYSGGDLPTQGEDLVAVAIRGNNLPNPTGGTFPRAARLAAFKCGHHGANTATSDVFLDTTMPSAAVISCGVNDGFKHPAQDTIDRLHNSPYVQQFFLTNCRYDTIHVPASLVQNQMDVIGNKSFLFGDNGNPGGELGHMRLSVSQAASLAASNAVERQFTVTGYTDADPIVAPGAGPSYSGPIDRTIRNY